MINGRVYIQIVPQFDAIETARRNMRLFLVQKALVRLHEYYVFWDGFGSLAAKTRGLIEHDRILNCEHRKKERL